MIILLEFSCLTVPKKFIGVPSCVSQTFWYRKSLYVRGGSWSVKFSVRNVLSRSAGKIVQESFSVSLIRVSKTFFALED